MSSNASIYSNKPDSSTDPNNKPPESSYIKTSKSISFTYLKDATSFQDGQLGDSDTYLNGTIHLNYGQPHQVKSVALHLKGAEKTTWNKAQARTKIAFIGEQILVDETTTVWESNDHREVRNLDIPFSIKLPYNLPETVTTELGSVSYTLRATVNRKGSVLASSVQYAEITCPLRKTLTMDQNSSPYKLRGESRSGLDYTFFLPANKTLNIGAYATIPMRLRFMRPGISVERVEILLKTCMDFRCSNPNETRHTKEQATAVIIPQKDISYVQPSSNQYDGECVNTIKLFVPRSMQPSYSGRFISIAHQLCVKFCLWGADMDFQVEESIRIANVWETCTNPDPSNIFSSAALMMQQPSRPEIPYDYQANIYSQFDHYPPQNNFSDSGSLRGGMKVRGGLDPRFLNNYELDDAPPLPPPPPPMRHEIPSPIMRQGALLPQQMQYDKAQQMQYEKDRQLQIAQQQLQAAQLQIQALQARQRRPSQSSQHAKMEPPFVAYNDGYEDLYAKKLAYDNSFDIDGNGDFWYRNNFATLNQYLKSAESKSPPLYPPGPPMNIYDAGSGMPSPKATPKHLPSYSPTAPPKQLPPYKSPNSPPPYRQKNVGNTRSNNRKQMQARQYLDSVTMYAGDFDD